MKSNPTASILLLVAALMLDMVAGPIILGKWVGLHFTAAAVALIGLRRGSWWGLAAGWGAGVAMASLSTAPFGLCMLSLGLTGFLAGLFRKMAQLDFFFLNALLILGLLFFEDACAGIAAWAMLGVRWHPAFLSVPLTVLFILLLPRRRKSLS